VGECGSGSIQGRTLVLPLHNVGVVDNGQDCGVCVYEHVAYI
jgi:hypothetical protein